VKAQPLGMQINSSWILTTHICRNNQRSRKNWGR